MSLFACMIDSMFEELAHGDDLSHDDDAVLVDAVTGWTRAVATAEFHRLAAITELTDRRGASEQAVERQFWACDAWDSAAAEVAAASGISARQASTQMHHGLALRYRLPEIAKLLSEGTLSARLAQTITWRTQLLDDPDVLTRVYGDLADKAASFGPLSEKKLENAIDAAIAVHDPAAVRRFRTAAKACDVAFGDRDDTTGTISMWGRLKATEAELFKRRLSQLSRAMCPYDPRTAGERRSAAVGVVGAGGTELPCPCGRPDCAAAGREMPEPTPSSSTSSPTTTPIPGHHLTPSRIRDRHLTKVRVVSVQEHQPTSTQIRTQSQNQRLRLSLNHIPPEWDWRSSPVAASCPPRY